MTGLMKVNLEKSFLLPTPISRCSNDVLVGHQVNEQIITMNI